MDGNRHVLTPGTSASAIHELACGLYDIINTIRVNQTVNWKRELNQLASELWLLMGKTLAIRAPEDLSTDEFSLVYMAYLKCQRTLAAFSKTVLATSRPNPQEVFGIVDPSQVRL